MAVKTKYEADVSQQIAAEARLAQSSTKLSSKYKDNAKAANEMERVAKKAFTDLMSPVEKHKTQLAQLDALYKKGRISIDQYAAGSAKINAELRKTQEQGKASGDALTGAFGATSLASLTTFAGGFGLITAGATKFLDVLKEIQEVHKQAAAGTIASQGGLGPLAQLASSPEEAKQLTDMARSAFGQGAAGSVGEAGQYLFALKSAGMMEDFGLVTELKSKNVLSDASGFVNAAATMRATFGQKETGSLRDLTSKAIASSEFAPASAEQILVASAEAAGVAKELGISLEEVTTSTAFLAKATNSASKGGTQLRSLLESFAETGEYSGKSLLESVDALSSRNLSFDELKKTLGETEAVNAFLTLRNNRGEIAKGITSVQRAAEDDRVGQAIRNADADPAIRAARLAVISTNQRVLSEESTGIDVNLRTAAQQGTLTGLREAGASEFALTSARWSQSVVDTMGINPEAVGAATAGASVIPSALNLAANYAKPEAYSNFFQSFSRAQSVANSESAQAQKELIGEIQGMRKETSDANKNQRMQRKSKAVTPQP